jgi:hypothetical protein
MALAKGVNSHAAVQEADDYFADRLDCSEWTDADSTRQAQALVTATSILDAQRWTGIAISVDQTLAFPRSGYYFDPRLGVMVAMNPTPNRIILATFELALHLLKNEGLQDDTGTVKGLGLSSINLNGLVSPSLLPAAVSRLIQPILLNRGSNSWWRAN